MTNEEKNGDDSDHQPESSEQTVKENYHFIAVLLHTIEHRSKKVRRFCALLTLLYFPAYHLVDAYVFLHKVYTVAIAIPIGSSAAKRSFSALKRAKMSPCPSLVNIALISNFVCN